MKEIIDDDKKIDEIEKIGFFSLTDEELMKQDQEYYYNQGLTDGYDKGINEIIMNLQNDGYNEEIISMISGRAIDYVKKIINARNN